MFIVYDKNMNMKSLPNGVRPLDIFISSIDKRRETEIVEGRPGIVTTGQTHANRIIEISLGLEAYDTRDYRLLRDEVFSFFDDDYFYISESYERGKRYKVTTIQSYIPERLNQRVARADFVLDLVDLPYAESIGTTQIINERGTLSDDELWGFGMGLIDDPDSRKYTHTGTTFKIYNAGNVPIHPFEQDLRIEIAMSSFVTGNSGLVLRNTTNGSEFRTTENVTAFQRIVLDGPNVTSGGLNYLRNTTKEFIELSPGWNEFEINVQATVAFDFRFYYR